MIKRLGLMSLLVFSVFIYGCETTSAEKKKESIYEVPIEEAKWIRNGEPIQFEGELWYPQDGIESFLDTEVILIEEFKNVQVFVDKLDVRPYDRLYTKFDKNKFRYFKRRSNK